MCNPKYNSSNSQDFNSSDTGWGINNNREIRTENAICEVRYKQDSIYNFCCFAQEKTKQTDSHSRRGMSFEATVVLCPFIEA